MSGSRIARSLAATLACAICMVMAWVGGHPPPANGGSNSAAPTSPTGSTGNATVLPNGRLVTPAGTLHDLGDFPLGVAVSPDGNLVAAINSGQGFGLNRGFNSYCTQGSPARSCPYTNPAQPALAATAGDPATKAPDESLSVLDRRTGAVSTVAAIATSYNPATLGARGTFNYFYVGIVFSPDGRHLYAAGGGNDAVYDFPVVRDVVAAHPARTVHLASSVPSFLSAGFTKGLAVTPDGRYLLVTHEVNDTLDILDTATYKVHQLSFGIPLLGDDYPYGVAASPDSRTAYVALQGSNRLAVVALNAGRGTVQRMVRVGDHPTAVAVSPDGTRVYVANANDDTLSVVEAADLRVAATLRLHALPDEALGSTPDAVTVSPDGQRIYVALAGDDAVAVVGSRSAFAAGARQASPHAADFTQAGLVPTGWYPSAVAVSPNGADLYIVSAKGRGSRPTAITSTYTYDANNMPGLLQDVPAPVGSTLQIGTQQVARDIRFASAVDAGRSLHSPIPAGPGGATPIQHVVLIVRENRTFDQVLGDTGVDESRTRSQLDAEPSFTVFGRDVTPNAHALVGDPVPGHADPAFATSDNFYSDGEASIQGHFWTASANVSDYVEKSWRQYYSPRHHLTDSLSTLAESHNCSLFQSALARQTASHGQFSFRDYGEVVGISNPDLIALRLAVPGNSTPAIPGHCAEVPPANVSFAGGSDFNLDMDNRKTGQAFLHDVGLQPSGAPLKNATAGSNYLRNFSYLIMAGDHTGALQFANTPRSRVAQNDAGVGMVVQAISHSAYWSSTAIFVMEDDSQDGLDHRDGHRNLLYVISPYARHVGPDGKPGYIGHRHYSQVSVLKTIDLLCGFPFLSTYDQNASPLYDLFQDKNGTPGYTLTATDLLPFTMQPAPSFIDESSARYKGATGAALPPAESRSLDLSSPDLAGPLLEIVNWQLAHPGSTVPASLARAERSWWPGAEADDRRP